MTRNCIKHPDNPVYIADPFCESIFCKECYDKMNKIYEKCYKNQSEAWITGEYITKEQAKEYWPDKD